MGALRENPLGAGTTGVIMVVYIIQFCMIGSLLKAGAIIDQTSQDVKNRAERRVVDALFH